MKNIKKIESTWSLPKILISELKNVDHRLDKAIKIYEKNKNKIHPSISYIQAIELFDFGIDVTQLKIK